MIALILFEIMLVGFCIFLGAYVYSEETWKKFRAARNLDKRGNQSA